MKKTIVKSKKSGKAVAQSKAKPAKASIKEVKAEKKEKIPAKKTVVEKPVEKKKKKSFDSKIPSSQNAISIEEMDNLIGNAPAKEEHKNSSKGKSQKNIFGDEILKNMVHYGQVITDSILGCFMMQRHGHVTVGDIQQTLNVSSKDFEYEIVPAGHGKVFIKIKKDGREIQCPEKPIQVL